MFRDGVTTLSLVIALISVGRIPYHIGKAPTAPPNLCLAGNREDLMVCGRPLRVELESQPEIELIPGMSPKLAERLISDRTDVFQEFDRTGSVEKGLERVKGIGKKRAERFAPYLSLY